MRAREPIHPPQMVLDMIEELAPQYGTTAEKVLAGYNHKPVATVRWEVYRRLAHGPRKFPPSLIARWMGRDAASVAKAIRSPLPPYPRAGRAGQLNRKKGGSTMKTGAEPEMPMWVVYSEPKDFPGEFVARRHVITGENQGRADPEIWARAKTLEALRAQLPLGLVCLGRDQSDDTCIVETWV